LGVNVIEQEGGKCFPWSEKKEHRSSGKKKRDQYDLNRVTKKKNK